MALTLAAASAGCGGLQLPRPLTGFTAVRVISSMAFDAGGRPTATLSLTLDGVDHQDFGCLPPDTNVFYGGHLLAPRAPNELACNGITPMYRLTLGADDTAAIAQDGRVSVRFVSPQASEEVRAFSVLAPAPAGVRVTAVDGQPTEVRPDQAVAVSPGGRVTLRVDDPGERLSLAEATVSLLLEGRQVALVALIESTREFEFGAALGVWVEDTGATGPGVLRVAIPRHEIGEDDDGCHESLVCRYEPRWVVFAQLIEVVDPPAAAAD